MSIAGGLHKAIEAGVAAGCDCLQIFVKNQRQWKAPPLTEERVSEFRAAQRQSGLWPVLAHATYLLNLASPDAALRRKSTTALVEELGRCEALGVTGLILHPGSHMGAGVEAGIRRIVKGLDSAHRSTSGYSTRVLLETTAGQGTSIGHEIGQLGRILDAVSNSDRLGICLDTCHLFAAGYDLADADSYDRLVADIERDIGLDRVRCVHVNDSKGACGSRLDRHEHIGRGRIGRRGFANFVNDARLSGVPRILETPKGTDTRARDLDRVNLARLRRLIRS